MVQKLRVVMVLLLLCGFFIVFSGCGALSKLDDIEDSGKFFEDIEEVNEAKDQFFDTVSSKITDDVENSTFAMDFFMVSSADTVGAIYYSVVNLYILTPSMVDTNITKDGDYYIITEEESVVKMKFDEKTTSSRLEFYENNNLDMVIESVKLATDSFAYQLYTEHDEESATVIQFLLNGENGKLSVDEEATAVPQSIYAKTSVASNFATTGTRIYKLENGNYTFEGSTNNEIPNPNPDKEVTNFSILSGLKATYQKDETFDVTDIIIKVTYDDNTTENITVTSSMVVGTTPNTSTIGQKSFELKYGEIQKTFTFNVIEDEATNEELLDTSFDNFFNTLFFDFDESLVKNYMLNTEILSNLDINNFFNYEFLINVSDQWSNIFLLSESITAIKAYSEGNLGTLVFEDPTNNFGKTAYCTYNETTQTYKVGYWASKNMNTLYWFESEVTFDAESDSVKALIKCGVDSQQLTRGVVEYTKINDGEYACMLYYPEDENDDQGKYSSFEFRFTKDEGDIAQNLWVENQPTSIYKSTNLSNYGKTGDKTLTLSTSAINFVDTLRCYGEEFLDQFIRLNDDYENSIEDKYLQHITTLAEDYYFDSYYYTLSYSVLDDYMEVLSEYERKEFDFSYYAPNAITVNGDTTTIELGSDSVYSNYNFEFKYSENKLTLELTFDDSTYITDLVKVNNTYYVQRIELYEGVYYVNQAKYVDMNNMSFSTFETETQVSSIYSSIPASFATTGDEVFTLTNGVLNHTSSYE